MVKRHIIDGENFKHILTAFGEKMNQVKHIPYSFSQFINNFFNLLSKFIIDIQGVFNKVDLRIFSKRLHHIIQICFWNFKLQPISRSFKKEIIIPSGVLFWTISFAKVDGPLTFLLYDLEG